MIYPPAKCVWRVDLDVVAETLPARGYLDGEKLYAGWQDCMHGF